MPSLPQLREAGVQPTILPGLPTAATSTQSSSRHKSQPDSTTQFESTTLPEHACLWLPSSVPHQSWTTVCAPGLVRKETRLRIALADDALAELRRQLWISSTLCNYKRSIGGISQHMITRMCSLMCRFATKTNWCVARYQAAYSALMQLDPEGEWTLRLKPLADKDIRSPHQEEDDPTEGQRELTWIWLSSRVEGHPIAPVTEDEIFNSKSCL
jgi:hypothetical protein